MARERGHDAQLHYKALTWPIEDTSRTIEQLVRDPALSGHLTTAQRESALIFQGLPPPPSQERSFYNYPFPANPKRTIQSLIFERKSTQLFLDFSPPPIAVPSLIRASQPQANPIELAGVDGLLFKYWIPTKAELEEASGDHDLLLQKWNRSWGEERKVRSKSGEMKGTSHRRTTTWPLHVSLDVQSNMAGSEPPPVPRVGTTIGGWLQQQWDKREIPCLAARFARVRLDFVDPTLNALTAGRMTLATDDPEDPRLTRTLGDLFAAGIEPPQHSNRSCFLTSTGIPLSSHLTWWDLIYSSPPSASTAATVYVQPAPNVVWTVRIQAPPDLRITSTIQFPVLSGDSHQDWYWKAWPEIKWSGEILQPILKDIIPDSASYLGQYPLRLHLEFGNGTTRPRSVVHLGRIQTLSQALEHWWRHTGSLSSPAVESDCSSTSTPPPPPAGTSDGCSYPTLCFTWLSPCRLRFVRDPYPSESSSTANNTVLHWAPQLGGSRRRSKVSRDPGAEDDQDDEEEEHQQGWMGDRSLSDPIIAREILTTLGLESQRERDHQHTQSKPFMWTLDRKGQCRPCPPTATLHELWQGVRSVEGPRESEEGEGEEPTIFVSDHTPPVEVQCEGSTRQTQCRFSPQELDSTVHFHFHHPQGKFKEWLHIQQQDWNTVLGRVQVRAAHDPDRKSGRDQWIDSDSDQTLRSLLGDCHESNTILLRYRPLTVRIDDVEVPIVSDTQTLESIGERIETHPVISENGHIVPRQTLLRHIAKDGPFRLMPLDHQIQQELEVILPVSGLGGNKPWVTTITWERREWNRSWKDLQPKLLHLVKQHPDPKAREWLTQVRFSLKAELLASSTGRPRIVLHTERWGETCEQMMVDSHAALHDPPGQRLRCRSAVPRLRLSLLPFQITFVFGPNPTYQVVGVTPAGKQPMAHSTTTISMGAQSTFQQIQYSVLTKLLSLGAVVHPLATRQEWFLSYQGIQKSTKTPLIHLASTLPIADPHTIPFRMDTHPEPIPFQVRGVSNPSQIILRGSFNLTGQELLLPILLLPWRQRLLDASDYKLDVGPNPLSHYRTQRFPKYHIANHTLTLSFRWLGRSGHIASQPKREKWCCFSRLSCRCCSGGGTAGKGSEHESHSPEPPATGEWQPVTAKLPQLQQLLEPIWLFGYSGQMVFWVA